MKLPDLISALCQHLGIDSLEPNEKGIYAIVFDDDLDIEILAMGSSQILIRSALAELPADKDEHEAFLRKQLQHNLANLRSQGAVLSLQQDSGQVWIYHLVKTDKMDAQGFCDLVAQFLNSVEWWRQIEPTNTTGAMPFNMLRP